MARGNGNGNLVTHCGVILLPRRGCISREPLSGAQLYAGRPK
jgi:hypothetical protein